MTEGQDLLGGSDIENDEVNVPELRSLRSGAQPTTLNGNELTCETAKEMVGVHIVGRHAMSMRKIEGEVQEIWTEGKSKQYIMAKVLFDNCETDILQLAGPGRSSFWTLPLEQRELARRAGAQAVSQHYCNVPPPIAKIDDERMVPMLIVPHAAELAQGNAALAKALGCIFLY